MSIAQQLYDDYVSKGVPPSSAAALAGVQNYENGSTLNAPNPGGDATGVFGISQWTGSRSTAAIAAGVGPGSSIGDQEDYTLSEMQSRNPSLYSSLMAGTASPSDIIVQYETPSGVVRGAINPNTPASRELAAAQTTSSGLFGGSAASGDTGNAYSGFNGSDFGSYNGTDLSGANTDGLFNNLDDDTFDGASTPGGIGSDAVAGNTAYSQSSDALDWSDVSDDAFDNSAPNVPSPSTIATGGALQGTPNLGGGVSQAGVNTATPTNAGQNIGGGGGLAVTVTDLPGLDTSISGGATTVAKGVTTAGQDAQTAAGGIVQTAASIFNNAQSYASGALVVIGLVTMGLVFVAFGLGMFKSTHFLPQFAGE